MKVIGLITYKYDKDYIEDLKSNLKGLVDEFIVKFDEHGDFWKHEGKYREDMVRQAEEQQADYVIVIDPDERLEKKAVKKLRRLMEQHLGKRVMYEFNFRELYTPNTYRVDGVWGSKERVMAFAVFADSKYSPRLLHAPREPMSEGFERIKTGWNVYHLKHIKPELRANRRDVYNALDPDKKFNAPGYDYLNDEEGMELKKVPFARMYKPAYRDYTIDQAMFEFANQKRNESKK